MLAKKAKFNSPPKPRKRIKIIFICMKNGGDNTNENTNNINDNNGDSNIKWG